MSHVGRPHAKKRMVTKPPKTGEYQSLELIDLNRQISELQEQLHSVMEQRDQLLEQNRSKQTPSYFM